MAELILAPQLGDIITPDGTATLAFQTWMAAITDAVNSIPPLTGSGSPEGAATATPGTWYVDTSAPSGQGIYYKESGDGDTGWVARS